VTNDTNVAVDTIGTIEAQVANSTSTNPQQGARCEEIPDTTPGVGYMLTEGNSAIQRVRAFHVTDADIAWLATHFTPLARRSVEERVGMFTLTATSLRDWLAPGSPAIEQAIRRACSPGYESWWQRCAAVGFCANPIQASAYNPNLSRRVPVLIRCGSRATMPRSQQRGKSSPPG